MPMIREKALRNESLETNNAKDCLQSCGYLSKWTSFLLFRVRILRIWGRKTEAKNDFTVWSHSAFLNSKSFALRMISAKFIRHSWITSDEKKVNKPLRRALRNVTLENPSQCEGFGRGHYNLHKSINTIRHFYMHFFRFDSLNLGPNSKVPLAFLSYLHYHRTNKKKEFFICTRIVFVAIISVFIPEWP